MPIPGDFPDLLHDFAREILRDQPDDIYEYGAAYFAALENVSIHSLSFRENSNFERMLILVFSKQGTKFNWDKKGKAIPPPSDRQPSKGSVKDMPEGPMAQEDEDDE